MDEEELLERFGDEEFLQELWLRTRCQLPEALAGIEALLETPDSQEQLASGLHRLRGLVSNFLEGGACITTIRSLEAANKAGNPDASTWTEFKAQLTSESAALDHWLTSRGYPCP